MRSFLLLLFLTPLLLAQEGFQPLFNGQNLDGWEVDTPGVWSVVDGVIIGKSPGLKYNDFLRTVKSYSNFILRAKFRLVNGEGNSGVQFRSKPAAEPHEVSGYQADVGAAFWGSLYDESRRRQTLARPDAEFVEKLDKDAWHEYVITARGNQIRLELDGVTTVEYREEDPSIETGGFIALQVHSSSAPIEAQFKDVMIRVLD